MHFLSLALTLGALDAGTDAGAPWNVEEPGAAWRDVGIDVTRGTWMSVDVSPRGDRVAFDLLGDLYVVPLDGGEAQELTHGAAWDMQPRFSPDGRELAFTSDRGGGDNVWVLPLDGGIARAVTSEKFRLLNSPTWSPDSRFIVARKHFTSRRSLGAGELWLYDRAGGEGVQLTEKPSEQKDLGEPAFSPDGRFVFFSQDVSAGKDFAYNKDPNGEIYDVMRLDLDTKETQRFVTGPGGSIRPTPSPDGRSLAFVRRVRGASVLMVADVQSGAERVVYEGLERDMQETWAIHGVAPAMAWTPDSKAIVFSAKGGLWRVDATSRLASPIPFHVKSTRRVFETVRQPHEVAPAVLDVKLTRWVQVSPKGDRVVFEALGKLWVKRLPDGEPKRLTTQVQHSELYPSFTFDGASIVYATWSDEGLGSVRVVPATGGEGRALTKLPGHYVEPTLSRDGSVLVYRRVGGALSRTALHSRETGLFALKLATGLERRLHREGLSPHFADAADRVYFLTISNDEKEAKHSLKSINLDASEERTHITSDEATEYRVSFDGRWHAWRENFNAFVMPFPRGAKAPLAAPESRALPVTRLSKDCGVALHWSADSKRVQWSWGGKVFSVEPGAGEPRVTALGLSQPAYVPAGVVAFVGARVITMRGDEVIEDGTIVVKNGRIAAVGPREVVTVPTGARVFDVKGKTVMPGLIDVHWHGTVGEDGIVPDQGWTLLASLAFGVTTVHDPSNDTETFFAASERARAGLITAPRLFSTGTILYGAQASFRAVIDSLDDARSHLRRLRDVGAFSVKSYNQPRREQRQMVLAAARELGMLVVPEGGSLLQHNLTMVVDGHTTIEHAIPVSRVYDDVLQLWSQTGTAWTPTLGVAYGGWWGENYWYSKSDVWADERLSRFVPRRLLDAASRRRTMAPDDEVNHVEVARIARALNERGVGVQLGAHGQREGLAAHWELWTLGLAGMRPLDVLKVGTINGARALGLDRDVGSLETGKLADLIVLDANPLDDVRNSRSVRLTVVGGRVWDSATMDELWPTARRRPPLYFEREGGAAWPAGVSATTEAD